MGTTAIDIADSVKTLINTGSYSQSVSAVRLVLPVFEATELSTLKVSVSPRSIEPQRITRSTWMNIVQIDVGVEKKAAEGIDIDVFAKTMAGLTEEIEAFLRDKKAGAAIFVKSRIDPIYSADHLLQDRVFVSVIRLEYRT